MTGNLVIDGLLERLDQARKALAAGQQPADLDGLLRDAAKEIAELHDNLTEAYGEAGKLAPATPPAPVDPAAIDGTPWDYDD